MVEPATAFSYESGERIAAMLFRSVPGANTDAPFRLHRACLRQSRSLGLRRRYERATCITVVCCAASVIWWMRTMRTTHPISKHAPQRPAIAPLVGRVA